MLQIQQLVLSGVIHTDIPNKTILFVSSILNSTLGLIILIFGLVILIYKITIISYKN